MWYRTILATGIAAGAVIAVTGAAPQDNLITSPPSAAALRINPNLAFRLTLPLSSIPDDAAVIRQFDADLATRFAFKRTIGQVLTSAGIADTPEAEQAMVQTLVSSFNANSYINPVSGVSMPVDVRLQEAGLNPAELLDPASPNGLIPIGLFNRLDLAPADWSDCGEHRIVYSTKPSAPKARFFVIFEAKLPNPNPSTGIDGCRAVASRWISAGRNQATRNQSLDQFYYGGLPGFRPVVDYRNYGSFLGQVRVNAFVNFTKWQLREFRVLPVAVQTLAFLPAPDSSNPLIELYGNGSGAGPLQTERTAFQNAFGSSYVGQFRLNDATLDAATSDADFKEKLFNTMGAAFAPRSNEFQSDSQGQQDNPGAPAVAGSAIRGQIPDSWASPVGARSISEAQMLARAGAVTCGGCHQFSAGQSIGTVNGQSVNWPSSATFVHISENTDSGGSHLISPALSDFFIPFRRKVTRTVYNRPLLIRYRLPLELIPGNAKLRAISPMMLQAVTRKRDNAETLARVVLAPAALPRVRSSVQPLARVAPLVRPQALELRRISDQAHAEELEQPGFFAEFRRPH